MEVEATPRKGKFREPGCEAWLLWFAASFVGLLQPFSETQALQLGVPLEALPGGFDVDTKAGGGEGRGVEGRGGGGRGEVKQLCVVFGVDQLHGEQKGLNI